MDSATPTDDSGGHSVGMRLARVLYGGVLATMALDNFCHLHQRIGYAQSKGAPSPDRSVPFISGSLLFGSLGILVWRLPRLASGAVATFLIAVTPVMHDFWTIDDPDQRRQQRTQFLKNTALLGGALAFLTLGSRDRQ